MPLSIQKSTIRAGVAAGQLGVPLIIASSTVPVPVTVNVPVAGAPPEKLGSGRLGVPFRMLYRVSFPQHDVWPDYRGGPADRLFVDLYEHWLKDER